MPGDEILMAGSLGTSWGSGSCNLTLRTVPAVPEPSTLAGIGLTLAGAFALRRKLTKK